MTLEYKMYAVMIIAKDESIVVRSCVYVPREYAWMVSQFSIPSGLT